MPERSKRVRADAVHALTYKLLSAIGEDPGREGLRETPRRVSKWWKEFMDYEPGTIDTAFQAIKTDQLIVLRGIKGWSLCEHHMLPFSFECTIGYLSGSKVLGVSKLARIIHKFSHRLQIQERLTHQISDAVMEMTGSKNVAVVVSGVHLCMVMRGIKSSGEMITSALNGAFRQRGLRSEFMGLYETRRSG